MAGDCAAYKTRYGSDGTFDNGSSVGKLKGFEVIDGLLYRRKLERGFINYREVLVEDRRHEAVSAFHRRPGTRHLSLEDTYKAVAENYWWEDMYFQIREHVLGCPERCHRSEGGEGRLSKTVAPHSRDVLSKLRSQREAGLFCDITLRTDGRSYCAHRAVLAAVSEYFQEIFAETDDASSKTDVDLTGFSEDSLLSLLDFSYSSTLSVRQENLHEVSAMARHLGMWPAVEACSALQREQVRTSPRCARTELSGQDPHQRRKKRASPEEDGVEDAFSLTLDASDESVAESPRRSLRGPSRAGPRGLLPLSPTHRMKLMDFKSPSCKNRSPGSRGSMSSPQSPSHSRLLRSSPGAAQEVLKLLPRPESPRRNKRSYPVHRPSGSSRPPAGAVGLQPGVMVEKEGEDEEDYARAQEKYRLMLVLGLQRTALLPRPEDLIGWRQKKRLRKLKANNYSLTKRRKPRPQLPEVSFGDLSLSLPLCNPVNTRFLSRVVKTEPQEPISVEEMRLKRPRHCVPPSDRSMRSKEGSSDLVPSTSRPAFGGRELRQSVRGGDGTPIPVRHPPPRHGNKALTRNVVRIKPEPVDYSISGPSNGCRGYTQTHKPPPPPPPRVQASNGAVAMETLRTVRYNGGRPPAKPRRGVVREARQPQREPRERGRQAGIRGLQGGVVRPAGALGDKNNRLQISAPVPPPSIYGPLYAVIKEEPADPMPVTGPFPDPPSPDLGKRQSKPPIKLLDPGFLFSFCRPAGAPAGGSVKREEESVDICLTRSVSQGQRFRAGESQPRVLRARLGPPPLPPLKKRSESQGRAQRPGSHSHQNSRSHLAVGSKVTRDMPKRRGKVLPLSSKKCVLLDSVRRARLKQLRGPCSQAPKGPKLAHTCPQCHATYRDCDALIMHRLRHVEGKQWPCPLCSKTFFRLRNVRNHIRTHDQKLYKCRSCIAAAS